MSERSITVFYSWQSDLPSDKTRNIIQAGIKSAVKALRDTVDVEADRDTKGEFGSPDIAQTIFSKIDNCDVFVADVTAVTEYEVKDKNGKVTKKYMPNPNVMLELGYAAKVVNWDNVICVLNSDYGAPQNMPFDISSRRLTPFSLENGNTKEAAKNKIRNVIQDTVANILDNGKRVKAGFSDLKVGSLIDNKVSNSLKPFTLSRADHYLELKKKTISECKEMFGYLKEIYIPPVQTDKVPDKPTDSFSSAIDNLNRTISSSMFKDEKIEFSEKQRIVFRENLAKYLGIEIETDDEVFNLGSLLMRNDMLQRRYLVGNEDEKNKYDCLKYIEKQLSLLDMWEKYVSTFDDYLFLPLVIENQSSIADESIDIYLTIDTSSVRIVYPSAYLIAEELKGYEDEIYEDEIVKTLLKMQENAVVSYDTDISFSIMDSQARFRARYGGAGICGNSGYSSDDYERELRKYIAVPADGADNLFVFSINSLRAKEKKWLGAAILLEPLSDSFEISYEIKSKHSDGSIAGKLEYNKK